MSAIRINTADVTFAYLGHARIRRKRRCNLFIAFHHVLTDSFLPSSSQQHWSHNITSLRHQKNQPRHQSTNLSILAIITYNQLNLEDKAVCIPIPNGNTSAHHDTYIINTMKSQLSTKHRHLWVRWKLKLSQGQTIPKRCHWHMNSLGGLVNDCHVTPWAAFCCVYLFIYLLLV